MRVAAELMFQVELTQQEAKVLHDILQLVYADDPKIDVPAEVRAVVDALFSKLDGYDVLFRGPFYGFTGSLNYKGIDA